MTYTAPILQDMRQNPAYGRGKTALSIDKGRKVLFN